MMRRRTLWDLIPGISIGTELTNEEMRTIFKCENMGGMRPSKKREHW